MNSLKSQDSYYLVIFILCIYETIKRHTKYEVRYLERRDKK
ncbi:hypothetical protein CNEO4_200069 [Clostridium neonatale]|nr:hypothetical protein CNEO4_200069 [Clostridium neonatale]CAI3687208.1 hypothetical protein CNEO2_470015 [Clostridium neonatale]